jgi:hypothetical protein
VNWRKLNETLVDMNEKEVLALLDDERANRRRVTVLTRLHQRYTILRAARERKEILAEAAKS